MNTTDLQSICDEIQGALTELHFTRIADKSIAHSVITLGEREIDHFHQARQKLGSLQARLHAEITAQQTELDAWIAQDRQEHPVYADGKWPGVR